jgi:putative ABC transport system permease protein
MMYDLFLSWRNLQSRPVQSLIPMVVMALAIGLTITVLALGAGVRRGIIQSSDPFGVLVIGPKGDSQRLVLNSILLQGAPLGTIPAATYDALLNDPRVRLAVPLAKGDNVGGALVIGTSLAFFELRTAVDAAPAFVLQQGTPFAQDFDAVLGSRAAQQLGLQVGDTFRAAHGVEVGLGSDLHDAVYTVVGILQPSSTPYDGAVFTTVNTVWTVHEYPVEAGSVFAIGPVEEIDGLTSILVQPTGFVEQNQLWQEYYTRTDAQAVFPGQELGGLFDLLGQGEQILGAVGYLVFAIAALTVFLSVYSTTVNREKDIAILRSLGGSRTNVFRMILAETMGLTLIGALLGRVIGYGTAALIAATFSQQSTIPVPIAFLTTLEPLLWLVTLGVGVAAGLLPAVLAYRVDVVEKLSAA